MNVLAGVVGALAIMGLLVAWRAPKAVAPLFLVIGLPLNAYAVLRGLVVSGAPGFLLAMLSAPYWLIWFALYVIGRIEPAGVPDRGGPPDEDGTLGSR